MSGPWPCESIFASSKLARQNGSCLRPKFNCRVKNCNRWRSRCFPQTLRLQVLRKVPILLSIYHIDFYVFCILIFWEGFWTSESKHQLKQYINGRDYFLILNHQQPRSEGTNPVRNRQWRVRYIHGEVQQVCSRRSNCDIALLVNIFAVCEVRCRLRMA